jgi:hypothetical protein
LPSKREIHQPVVRSDRLVLLTPRLRPLRRETPAEVLRAELGCPRTLRLSQLTAGSSRPQEGAKDGGNKHKRKVATSFCWPCPAGTPASAAGRSNSATQPPSRDTSLLTPCPAVGRAPNSRGRVRPAPGSGRGCLHYRSPRPPGPLLGPVW